MKKIVATIHQPTFLPWLGFFEKVHQADIFIVYDTSTVNKNTVINRNKIKTPQGEMWLTVPIHSSLTMPVNKMTTDETKPWRKNHLKTFFFNYKKAKNFEKIYQKLEKIYQNNETNLAEFNLKLIEMMMMEFGLKKKLIFVSKLKPKGAKNDILIDMLKKVGANTYYSGKGAKDYLDEELFNKNGIEVIWQDFKPIEYLQLWGKFMPNLSAIDYLFTDGRKGYFK